MPEPFRSRLVVETFKPWDVARPQLIASRKLRPDIPECESETAVKCHRRGDCHGQPLVIHSRSMHALKLRKLWIGAYVRPNAGSEVWIRLFISAFSFSRQAPR